jgi:hypothetical protein
MREQKVSWNKLNYLSWFKIYGAKQSERCESSYWT